VYQLLLRGSGEGEVTVSRAVRGTVRVGRWDRLSVPPGSRRSVRAVAGAADGGPANLVAVTGGDGRVRLEWDEQVVKAAVEAGRAIDHDGYLAPAALVPGAPGR